MSRTRGQLLIRDNKSSGIIQVRWVVNGRIVNNNTSPAPFSDQRWIIREESASRDNIKKWYNLTVTNAGSVDHFFPTFNQPGSWEFMVHSMILLVPHLLRIFYLRTIT